MRQVDIKNFENYQVTDDGRIWSKKSNKWLKQGCSRGYLIVDLCKDGKRQTYLVHRLVARAFIPNPNGLPQVNHKDENKANNYADNLEWCDCKYNINYGTHNERIAEKKKGKAPILAIEKTIKTVFQYTLDGELVAIYPSASEAARQNGFSQGHISSCCRGERKTHKGYKWSYIPL